MKNKTIYDKFTVFLITYKKYFDNVNIDEYYYSDDFINELLNNK